ncbi:MAG TPA: CHASE domain-containing protein, partial [Verrucomicrobiae bacterium]
MLLTISSTFYLAAASRVKDRIRFQSAIEHAEDQITDRISIYLDLLRGGAALFGVNENLSAQQFHAYANSLVLPTNYPGLQGFGFARHVASNEQNAFLQLIRGQGLGNYSIRPPGQRAEYFPVTYLEPRNRANLGAFGFDMFSEPNRRLAMEQARDTGQPATSGKVTLVQEEFATSKQAGFLMYLPVYRGGVTPKTVQERRASLLGFIYIPLRADDFFSHIFQGDPQRLVHLEVFDGRQHGQAARLHRTGAPPSASPQFTQLRVLEAAGRPWTLSFTTTPLFEKSSTRTWVPWISAVGLLMSFALFAVTAALLNSRTTTMRALEASVRHAALRAETAQILARESIDESALMQQCTEAMVRFVPAAFARIWTLNAREQVLELRASAGLYTHLDGPHSRVPLGSLKIGRIAQNRKPHLTNDIPNDPQISDPAWAREQGMVAFAGFPLLVHDKLLGVVALFAREYLPEDTLQSLQTVADLVAHGLHRRRTENALARSEERFRATFHQAAAGMVQVSLGGHFVEVNDYFCELVGYTREELLAKSFREITYPEDLQIDIEQSRRLTSGEIATYTLEKRYVRKNGDLIWISLTASLMREPETGKPEYFVMVVTDISERRQAEQNKFHLAAIVESSQDAILSVNLEGLIQSWNKGAEKMFGYASREIVGKPLLVLIPPERHREETEFMTRLRRGERIEHYETVRLRKGGVKIDVSLSISPINDPQGRFIGISKILRDITESKRLQLALAQAQSELKSHAEHLEKVVTERTSELRETIAELESFSYSLSHDMRAPLRAMKGFSQILEEEFGAQLGPEGNGYLKKIGAAAGRLDQLIQDVLTYSHVVRDRVQLEPVNISKLLHQLIDENPV